MAWEENHSHPSVSWMRVTRRGGLVVRTTLEAYEQAEGMNMYRFIDDLVARHA